MIVEMDTAFAAAQVAEAALVEPPGAWMFACSETFASQDLMVCLPAGLNGATVVRKSCVFSSLSPSVLLRYFVRFLRGHSSADDCLETITSFGI